MSDHHAGGVAIAQDAASRADDAWVVDTADRMARIQSSEIAEMEFAREAAGMPAAPAGPGYGGGSNDDDTAPPDRLALDPGPELMLESDRVVGDHDANRDQSDLVAGVGQEHLVGPAKLVADEWSDLSRSAAGAHFHRGPADRESRRRVVDDDCVQQVGLGDLLVERLHGEGPTSPENSGSP